MEYTHSHIHENPVYSGFKDIKQLKVKLPIFSFIWKFMVQQDDTKPPNIMGVCIYPVYSLACAWSSSNTVKVKTHMELEQMAWGLVQVI